VPLANRKHRRSDLAASATSVRRNSWSWHYRCTGVEVPVGSPDLADREGDMVAVSSMIVTDGSLQLEHWADPTVLTGGVRNTTDNAPCRGS